APARCRSRRSPGSRRTASYPSVTPLRDGPSPTRGVRPVARTRPRREGDSLALRAWGTPGGGLRHGLLDHLQEEGAVLLGGQLRDLLVRGRALVVVEDGELLHRGVEDAPPRPHRGRR